MLCKHELPGPHEVVQDQACFDNELDSGGVMDAAWYLAEPGIC